MNRRQLDQPAIKEDGVEKKEFQTLKPFDDGEDYTADPMALRAFRAVLDPRHHPDRSAARAMWQRIADSDLAATPFGFDEQQFIQTVAAKMIGADKLDSKKRPDAVLAASGLSGTHREQMDTRIKEIADVLDDFDVHPAKSTLPTAASKKFSKRNISLAIYASDPDLMRNFSDVEKLRKRVNKVKDNTRKK